MKVRFLVLLIWLFCSALSEPSDEFKRYKVNVGESIDIALPEGANLTVSKKGVVELHALAQGKWRVVGMRRGFVKVTWFNEEVEKQESFFIAVGLGYEGRERDSKEIPSHICQLPGIECTQGNTSLAGHSQSFSNWLQAKQACGETKGCLFFVTLSSNAQQEAKTWLTSVLGEGFDVRFQDNRSIYVACACNPSTDSEMFEWAEAVSAGIVGEQIPIRCLRNQSYDVFRLNAKIILLEKSVVQNLGLDFAVLHSRTRESKSHLSFVAILNALENKKKAKVIAEPMLILSANQKASLTSGGEIKVMYHTTETKNGMREGWKKIGLEFDAMAERLKNNTIRTQIKMQLRNRVHQLEDHLTSNSIDTTVDLELGKSMVIGTANTESTAKQDFSVYGLSDLPIIGPLLRSFAEDTGNMQLFLWIEILPKGDDASDIFPPQEQRQPAIEPQSISAGGWHAIL